jgi:PTH1 family peptidyl-tRNA hydrolase
MNLIIGLGNPGKEFEQTPHNIGFDVLDYFAKQNDFPEFELDKKANALVSKKGKVTLAKPQTFMNDSGKSVKVLAKQLTKKEAIVIHDDKDLPLGTLRIVQNRGSAGHKGVESVIKAISNKNITRIRVGTGVKKKEDAMKTVIKHFKDDDFKLAKKAIKKASDALDCLLKEGMDQAMNQFHRD